ncbi:CRISPR-associated endonuclease Cas3'' [Streptomyces sp. NA02950]|nr:CRISPR-associated endonuclease Cas3'' [Streptomyces sp. NA02950]QKV90421.1 CRISPR-associated endonuclease Cas3'' [Streptomyces sp. NA02950]QKV97246.1 CRISPR-associated endonuclease Cas3'' [Streptomyces sp. NA02950]
MWGKARGLPWPYPLVCHLLDTAAMAGRLWDVMLGHRSRRRIAECLELDEGASRRLVGCWACLHDLGKVTPPFQSMVGDRFHSASARATARWFVPHRRSGRSPNEACATPANRPDGVGRPVIRSR